MRPQWILNALSIEQQAAFGPDRQHMCMLASAGSGKTRTLSYRLAADLADGVLPQEIVAFTFTEKAADELTARIHQLGKVRLTDTDLAPMFIGTIHAWCLQHLLKQPRFYGFNSLDELHVRAMISRLHDQLRLDQLYSTPFPGGIPQFVRDLAIYHNEHIELGQVPSKIRAAVELWASVLRRNRLLTFGDMVCAAADHLREEGPVAGLVRLYVDEYQDVNPAQVELIRAMLPSDSTVVVVGDDLQCIYQWRGSDVEQILSFSRGLPESQVVRLRTNYRSRPDIIAAGNAVAGRVSVRDPSRVMRPHRPAAACPGVHWISCCGEADQAVAAAQVVRRYLDNGVPPRAIAILLRSVRLSGQPIIGELERLGIQTHCPTLRGGAAFVDEFVSPVLGWLSRAHPEPRSAAQEAEIEAADDALWQGARPWVTATDGELEFWTGLGEWYQRVQSDDPAAYNVRDSLYTLMERCGVCLQTGDGDLLAAVGIVSQIIRSVEEVHRRRLRDLSRRPALRVMSEVREALAKEYESFGESLPIDKAGGGVVVTTVHQAKGLEWPVVIVPGLMQGLFPLGPRAHQTSFPDAIARRYGTTYDDERRLFYVAITRARDRLFLLDGAAADPRRRSSFLRGLCTAAGIAESRLDGVEPSVWRLEPGDLAADDSAPLRIALSDLLLYLECPFQFGLRRRSGIQPAIADDLGFGKSLHEILQRRAEADAPWTDDELDRQVDQYVHIPYLPTDEQEADLKQTIRARTKRLDGLGVFQPAGPAEMNVEVLLAGGLVHGIVDGVLEWPDGSYSIRDWKSNIHRFYLQRYERQLQLYAYALRQRGYTVRSAELVDVGGSDRQGRLVAVPVDISDHATSALVRRLEDALRHIAACDYPAVPSPTACSCCDVRRVCGERHHASTDERE